MFGKLSICDSSGRNPQSNPFIITQQFTYVGKDKDCDIRFENPQCAGKQFLLTASGDGLVKIQNLTKKYATQVNKKSIGFQVDHDLKEQDIISAAGQLIMWSYQISASESLPRHSALKRTRHSEPIRKVAIVTPNRREQIVEEEESLQPAKRRKTFYEPPSVHSYTSHDCSHLSEQSSFARRVSYDKMLRGRNTPAKNKMTSRVTPRRLGGSLLTPSRGSAQKNKKTSISLSPCLVYNHETAFNNSITPRTFYAGGNSKVPFTFRGFNPVPEESDSSILPADNSFRSVAESEGRGRRSRRVSTPVPPKKLASQYLHSARTSRNKSIHTGTPNVYYPTIQEGRLMESARRLGSKPEESYMHEKEKSLMPPNDPNFVHDSTPASYFSPTSSGTPRMMRAESPNIQLQDVNGSPRSTHQGRRSLVTSSCSTPFGTPQEVFQQSQYDSLFVNTSGSSQIRQRRSHGSFLVDQTHYNSRDSIMQSPQSLSYNTPSQLNTPRRSRSVMETPGSSSFSPMSYNDTDYVLLSPRGRNILTKRYGRSDHSNANFSQSPYSPSEKTLDFTASPSQHRSPRFARTPKRSLSVQVLTKSLKKKPDYGFSVNNPSSPTPRKSQRMSQSKSDVSLSKTSRTPVTPSASKPKRSLKTNVEIESDAMSSRPSQGGQTVPRVLRKSLSEQRISPAQVNTLDKSRQSGNTGADGAMTPDALPVLASDTSPKQSTRKSSRPSSGKERMSDRVSRRSLSVPSGTPTQSSSARNSRKSGNTGADGAMTPDALLVSASDTPTKPSTGKSSRPGTGKKRMSNGVSRRSLFVPSGTPTQSSSARNSKKSGNMGSDITMTPDTPLVSASDTPTKPSTRKSSRPSSGKERMSNGVSRRSLSVLSGTPTQSSFSRNSRNSGNLGHEEIPTIDALQTIKRSGTFVYDTDSEISPGKSPRLAHCEEDVSNHTSLRSRSALRDTPIISTRKSRKSETIHPVEISTHSGLDISNRSSRRSRSAPLGTPAQSSSARKSRKSGMEEHSMGNSEPIVPISPRRSGMNESKSILKSSRLNLTDNLSSSQNVKHSPLQSNSSHRSTKSGNVGVLGISSPSARQTPKRSGTFVHEAGSKPNIVKPFRSSKGEQSIQSVTSTLTSSTQKLRNSGARGFEDNPELNASQGKVISSSSILGRSQSGQSDSPTRVNSLRKSKISGNICPEITTTPDARETLERSGTFVFETDKKLSVRKSSRSSVGGERKSNCISLQSLSASTPTQSSSTRKLRASHKKNIEEIPSQDEEALSSKVSRRSLSVPASTPTQPISGHKSKNSVKSSTKKASSEGAKLLSNAIASESTIQSLTPSFTRGSHDSARLDESTSSIANISAIPKSLRKTRVMFSTPDPSKNKKSVKITSTPFPTIFVSGQDGTRELSFDSTLPIEIDTVNFHGNYISSDSPDYDKITDEESFDVPVVPKMYRGRAAIISKIKRTPKSSSKLTPSFVAIKSGIKNRKSKTPPSKNDSLEEKSQTTSKVSEPNPSSTSSTAGKRSRRSNNEDTKSRSKNTPVKIVTPKMNQADASSQLASSLNNSKSLATRRSVDNSKEFSDSKDFTVVDNSLPPSTPNKMGNSSVASKSCERNAITIPKSITSKASNKTTPPRTVSPEVVLRSSKKSARRSVELSIPGTPTSAFKRNPRRMIRKTSSPSASSFKRKLEAVRSPTTSAVKKLKLDPDKPDKKKMAALWVCHKKKSPTKTAIVSERKVQGRRSFDKTSNSPPKFNKTVPRNFKFQSSGPMLSSSLLEESRIETSGKQLTPIKDLDTHPQQLSPEDDLLNALDLSRKSAIAIEPQKPSRRLRSSTQRRTTTSGLPKASPSEKSSPSKSSKKLLFRSPLEDYEGSQNRRGTSTVNSSNIKSILIPSPTTSSDEPMSRVFTTSPVVDFTDSSGKKKIFRASPTSMGGGIRELIPSEEIDLTGVRDLFEPSPSSSPPSARSAKRSRKSEEMKDLDVSPPKISKVSPPTTDHRLNSGSKKSAKFVVGESNQSSPSLSKSPVGKRTHIVTTKSIQVSERNSKRGNESLSDVIAEFPVLAKRSKKTKNFPSSKTVKRVRISVGAAKSVIKNKAVGSTQSRSKKVVNLPNNRKSVGASKRVANEVTSSKESPRTVSSKKNSKRESPAKNVDIVVSPKRLRSKKTPGKIISAVKPSEKSKKSPTNASTASKKITHKKNKETDASSEKPRSTRSADSVYSSKKAPTTKNVKEMASPKKLRSKKVEATNEAEKESKKVSKQKKVSESKKSLKTSNNVEVVVSSKKQRSKKQSVSKEVTVKASTSKASAVDATTAKDSFVKVDVSPKKLRSKKVVAMAGTTMKSAKKVSTPKKVVAPKKTNKSNKNLGNVKAVESPTRKALTLKKTPQKVPTKKEGSSSKKASTPKRTAEKMSTAVSPKKLRAKKGVSKEAAPTTASAKKSAEKTNLKRSAPKSKSGSPAIKHVAAKAKTEKRKSSTLKKTTSQVSPKKMRSAAKPKKTPPEQVTRHRR